MDKTVMIVGALAVVAILGFTLIVNPFGNSDSKSTEPGTDATVEPETTTTEPEDKDDKPSTSSSDDDIDYVNATYGTVLVEVEGDCQLYMGIATDKYECFGRAGAYEILATNEYKVAESEEYFCKATKFGCKLYQKVTFSL